MTNGYRERVATNACAPYRAEAGGVDLVRRTYTRFAGWAVHPVAGWCVRSTGSAALVPWDRAASGPGGFTPAAAGAQAHGLRAGRPHAINASRARTGATGSANPHQNTAPGTTLTIPITAPARRRRHNSRVPRTDRHRRSGIPR